MGSRDWNIVRQCTGLPIAIRLGMDFIQRTIQSRRQTCVRPNVRDQPIAWMRHRLRTTFWILVFLTSIQSFSALPSISLLQSVTVADGQEITDGQELTAMSDSIGPNMDTNSESTQSKVSNQTKLKVQLRAVAPTGWRRTSKGWQNVSSWRPMVQHIPLSQRVIAQRESQPAWLQRAMTSIRRTPPGCVAIAQLVCVGMLFLAVGQKIEDR